MNNDNVVLCMLIWFSVVVVAVILIFVLIVYSLGQINPLAETSNNQLVAADAKLNFDDNAAFRQKQIFSLRDPSEVNLILFLTPFIFLVLKILV